MKTPYETSYKLACDEFSKLNLEEVAFNSSARLEGDIIYIDFLGETFMVKDGGEEITTSSPPEADLPQAQGSKNKTASEGREVKINEKILLLHYLITADGTAPAREEVTLENIPGASFYYPTYKARSIDLIVNKFIKFSSEFIAAAGKIGFNITETTNRFSRLKSLVLPNVSVSFILWKDTSGDLVLDNELLKITYDAGIIHYLPLEDIIILTELVCHKIIKSDYF
ncbi:MAG: DUF3786 domain-containing protein [Planctomycetota bacterium]